MTARRLRGIGASAGVAVGPAVVFAESPLPTGGRVVPGGEADEIQRFEGAAGAAADELEALSDRLAAAGHEDESAIFVAQAAMARDPGLASAVERRVRDAGDDAIGATLAAADDLAATLRALDDELLAARAGDVQDVAGRIARRLAGRPSAEPSLAEPSVVVAADLPPSVAATLPRERLLGFALESGSPTAHAAILARAYGIPAVVGVAGLLEALREREPPTPDDPVRIAVDGGSGEVVVDPEPADLDRFADRRIAAEEIERRDLDEAKLPTITQDGLEVVLLANIGTPAEAHRARELGARGVGLFRTEFLFLERAAPPSEDEQARAYTEVVERFAPDPVTIRLLDVGGDKPIPYLRLPDEANPFLGVRALRLAATAPELFVTQLRAAMRAGLAGPVKVMAPMVADGDDVALLRDLAERAHRSLEADGVTHARIELGVMIEIPAAVVLADRLLPELDFASLGTNDLLQYTVAADRGNPALFRYHDPLHPALLRLVRDAVAAAERAGVELSVCGEMAGDPVAAEILVGLGIRRLSMAASSLGPVRRRIRAAEARDLERRAGAALQAATPEKAREIATGR